jgi:Protein kinase domain
VVTAPDIPGHRVGGVLGAGGFATVYRCWQLAVGREVAVKVDNRVLLTERDRRRFLREVTAAGRLSGHPHVIDVYDAGTLADGRPYLVMELCPAGSLHDALRRHGPMPAARVRDIGIRLADALAAAHASGVLHRDIKPANILVNRFGMVGLSDFGLASIISARGEQTASREALTPAYSSPETFRGEEPTVLADVYSLAATLYALLAGRPPRFAADGSQPGLATLMSLHGRPVEDVPGTPPELMALLRTGLSPDPAARPQSAAELRDALTDPRPYAAAASGGYASQASAPPTARPASMSPATPAAARPASMSPATPAAAGPARVSPAAREAETRGPRRPARHLALAAGLVVIIAAALFAGARFLPHGGGPAAAPARTETGPPAQGGGAAAADVYGIRTTSAGCPAAALRVARARCPASPECFAGIVTSAGSSTARPLGCDQPHTWETFAIAILPITVRTFDQPVVAADPTVRMVCSQAVMLASRRGQARRLPAPAWDIAVLPPSEAAFGSGSHVYRCLADQIGHQPHVSQFRR